MGIAVFPAAGGGVTPKVQTFTSTGTFTAPSNCQYVEVFLVAGGGGGGAARNASNSCSGGGGGGGAVADWVKLAVTPGTSYTVTIGAGGAGSTSTAAGADGTDSSFGSLLTVYGGGGGGTIDAGSSVVAQRARGTIGGGPQSGTGTGKGGGGGASQSPAGNGTTQPFVLPADDNNLTAVTGIMQGGYSAGVWAQNQFPGVGVNGYGGGGHGPGVVGRATSISVHGGAAGAGVDANGNNATANFGGGGSGAGKSGTNAVRSGGNGGSGYAIVVYWS